jgi:glycosyltransferase involved in cell wall biosynthesis
MQVLHVIQTLSTRFGGPVVSLKALARHQARSGHEVTICTTNSDYPRGTLPVQEHRPEIANGVSIWYHPVQFRPLVYSEPLRKWINASIKEFSVVHVHGLYRFPVTYAAWVARKAGVPYIISPHGALDPFLYRRSKYSLLLKRLYERLFDMPNLNGAAAINYATQDELESARFLGINAPAAVVPHGIDWRLFDHLPPRGCFRAHIGVEPDVPLVLYLGRINFKKGIDLLIPAFAKLAQTLPRVRLAMVGPDNENYGPQVRRWCQDHGIAQNVIRVDHMDPGEVSKAYVDADVLVLPSYTENLGMVAVEAMACQCPVIVSDRIGISPDIIKSGAGLVARLDPEEIAKAMLSVLTGRPAAREMGAAGRRLAETRFTYDRIVAKVSRMYETAIQSRQNVSRERQDTTRL